MVTKEEGLLWLPFNSNEPSPCLQTMIDSCQHNRRCQHPRTTTTRANRWNTPKCIANKPEEGGAYNLCAIMYFWFFILFTNWQLHTCHHCQRLSMCQHHMPKHVTNNNEHCQQQPKQVNCQQTRLIAASANNNNTHADTSCQQDGQYNSCTMISDFLLYY